MIECIRKGYFMKRLLCLFGVLVLVVGCSKKEVDDGAILSVSKDGEAVVQEFDKYFEMEGQDIYMETNLRMFIIGLVGRSIV